MTPDQGPSHFNPSLPEIPWPTEVAPRDLNKIRAECREGKSLATSIAIVITKESYSLINPALNDHDNFTVISSYREASVVLIDTERALKTGEHAVTMQSFEMIAGIREEKDPEEAREILVFAAGHHIEQKLLDRVFRDEGPLGFIDFYTRIKLQYLKEISSAFAPTLIELWEKVYEQGQRRFHQLYEAAQAAGIGG